MPVTTLDLKPETDAAVVLATALRAAGTSSVVLLADGQLMARRLRRLAQQTGIMPPPRVTTDSAWLEETLLFNLPENVLPSRILNPQQLSWFIRNVIQDLDTRVPPIFHAPEGLQSVVNWLAETAAEGVSLQRSLTVFESFPDEGFPLILRQVTSALEKQSFLPRVFVPVLAERLRSVIALPDVVIRWEPAPLPVSRERAFATLQTLAPQTDWIQITTAITEENRPEKAREFVQKQPEKVIARRCYQEETELDLIFREISHGILQEHKKPGDYVILSQDIETYRALALRMSEETGIPLYVSKGAALIALPLVRRYLLLFELLDQNDDVDALLQVFGDQLLKIGAFSGIETKIPPRIREFSTLSRKKNTPTMAGMRASSDRGDDSKGLAEAVLAHIDALRKRFSVQRSRLLSEWFGRFIPSVFEAQPVVGSEIAGNLRNTLSGISVQMSEEFQLLGIDRIASWSEALALFRETVSSVPEPAPELPDAVLFTEPDRFSLTFGKAVFMPGMKEGTWPFSPKTDFLKTSWREQADLLFPDRIGDRWQHTVNRFTRLAASARHVSVTCPFYSGTREVNPSPLFVEIFSKDHKPAAMKTPVRNRDIAHYEAHFPDSDVKTGRLAPTARLSSWIKASRSQPEPGLYDGNLTLKPELLPELNRLLVARNTLQSISASRLDRYIASPFGFFMGDVLGIEEPMDYRDLLDPEEKGNLIHRILGEFYTEDCMFTPGEKPVIPHESPAAAERRLNRIFEAVLEEKQHVFEARRSPFVRKLKADIERSLQFWLQEEKLRSRNGGFFNSYLPAVFHPAFAAIVPAEGEILIPLEGTETAVYAKIDRVDIQLGDDPDFVVIDYKTGSVDRFTRKEVLNGMLAQMPMYLYAVSTVTGIRPGGAFYWGIKPGSPFLSTSSNAVLADGTRIPVRGKQIELSPDDIATIPALFIDERLRWMLLAIRDGRFNLPLETASYPGFQTVSRIDPALQKFRLKREKMSAAAIHAQGKLENWYCAVNLLSQPDNADTEEIDA